MDRSIMRIPPIVAAKMGWNEAQIFSARDVEPNGFHIARDPLQSLNCSEDGGSLDYRGEFEINLKTYVQRQCGKCGVTEIFYEA